MAYTLVLSDIPKVITAGESVSWRMCLVDYPADSGWKLSYFLLKPGNFIWIDAVADGRDHLVEIPFSQSAEYEPGDYHYQAHVADATERYRVDKGEVTVLPDFSAQTEGYDGRSWFDVAIDALEASIQGRASKTQLAQTVGGVQVQHMSLSDQLDALGRLKQIRAGKGKFMRTIKPRFPS